MGTLTLAYVCMSLKQSWCQSHIRMSRKTSQTKVHQVCGQQSKPYDTLMTRDVCHVDLIEWSGSTLPGPKREVGGNLRDEVPPQETRATDTEQFFCHVQPIGPAAATHQIRSIPLKTVLIGLKYF